MKQWIGLVVLSGLLGTACNQSHQPETPAFPEKSAIVGLASPVQLQSKETTILLEDFFLDPAVDSIVVPDGFAMVQTADQLVLTGAPDQAVTSIQLFQGGYSYDIPLKRYKKTAVEFTFEPGDNEYQSVSLKGEMNDWNPSKTPLELVDGVWKGTLELFPGNYQYLIVADGSEFLDDRVEEVSNGIGGFNSLLKVERPDAAALPQLSIEGFAEGKLKIQAKQSEAVLVFWENHRLDESYVSQTGETVSITLPQAAAGRDRTHLRIWSSNAVGEGNDLLIPLDKGTPVTSTDQLTRFDKEASVLYFMLVDRFYNGNTENDQPVDDERVAFRANYQGGDIPGILAKLKEGFFEDLNINTLWLSPITQNPLGAYQEYPEPHRWYSGYHGYWPITFTTVDHRLGTSEDLKALVDEAHARDMNVILDFVSNHVHEEHAFYQANPTWATQLDLEDGTKNIRIWEEQRLTTWFDTFLPSLDHSVPEVTNVLSDSAMFWIKQYDLDGFRHDATKHIPNAFWRTLTRKMKRDVVAGGKRVYQVGETFGSRDLIGSYVSSGMLDGQFDFNLYFDAVAAFQDEETSFERLSGSLRSSLEFYGSHSLMGNITGNHDLTRFITLAGEGLRPGEDHKEAGWARDIQVENPVGYKRLQQLSAFILTVPGVPVVYYGDDIGMPGGNDPDNRRMMRFDGLSADEQGVKDNLRKLTALRKSRMSLLYGDLQQLHTDPTALCYSRAYFDDYSVIAFNKSGGDRELSVPVPERYATNLEAQFGGAVSVDGGQATFTVPANGFQILTVQTPTP